MSKIIRIIPCLDLDQGRVVKGVRFTDLQDAGDPVELAQRYLDEGADELTLLDVSATLEGRDTTIDTLHAVAATLPIPITIGGGVRELADATRLLEAGARRVSVNTAAITRPELLAELATAHGPAAVVLSIDARKHPSQPSGYEVTTHGGKKGAGIDVVEWARQAEQAGVGVILLNSIDADGTKDGFDLDLLSAVRSVTELEIIASGGAGKAADFVEAAQAGADGVLAASVFHYGIVSIGEVKNLLHQAGFVS
ncbi:MAG TPA: imidazole glycerol phosphate synthase subunit HisF [Beutenbergiaceae bacterium]|nr:imidazole glycerol phosphate synthase subunit HisF [Beutenbergiaceae bacterium]